MSDVTSAHILAGMRELTPWQSRQAAMLYHYASLDHLKRLHAVVTQMIEGVLNPLLDRAAIQQRDPLLRNSQWGDRNTSENWSNYGWPFLKELQTSLAKDLVTGQVPPRTGVYMSADDPHTTLQFANSGNDGIKLRDASTFSEIGLDALVAVGRNDLRFNKKKMLDYVLSSTHYGLFRETVEANGKPCATYAPLAVAEYASVTHPSTWYFVEIIDEDFEATDFPLVTSAKSALHLRLRGGET